MDSKARDSCSRDTLKTSDRCFLYPPILTSVFVFFYCLLPAIGRADNAAASSSQSGNLPFRQGERIVYDIRKLNLKIGEAALTFHGLTQLDHRQVFLITFVSKGPEFFDEERIFLDPETFFPIQVQRDINIFGRKEKIVEHYSPHDGVVEVVKTVREKTSRDVIRKPQRLDNLYCFIYRYRRSGGFRIGEDLQMHLPTKDVQFKLLTTDPLKINGKPLDAYYMESIPKKYRVWFSKSQDKIPLRIDGAVGFGKTALVMREYHR